MLICFVGWLVSQQDYTKSATWIFMKPESRMVLIYMLIRVFFLLLVTVFVDVQKGTGGRWADVRSSQCYSSLSLMNSIATSLPKQTLGTKKNKNIYTLVCSYPLQLNHSTYALKVSLMNSSYYT